MSLLKFYPAPILSFIFFSSCAQPQARIIEPGVSQPSGSGGTNGAADDESLTLSRAPRKTAAPAPEFPIHLADKWFTFRGEYLGMNAGEASARDDALPEQHGPDKFWDEQTAIEAVSIWTALCNECHGGRRKIKDGLAMPAPAKTWGRGEGLFFGKRRPYGEIFKTIMQGGPVRNGKPSEMPAWKSKLAKEQIWSLIYFLEFQSGGIEGVFPPSLYPRGVDERG
jgi:mono/diheme cytochrome c family protein